MSSDFSREVQPHAIALMDCLEARGVDDGFVVSAALYAALVGTLATLPPSARRHMTAYLASALQRQVEDTAAAMPETLR